MISKQATANTLIEALEYIMKFRGSLFVIKLGGEVMLDKSAMDAVAKDLILLNQIGIKPVVVHGGGKDISRAMKKFGKKPKFVQGLRITDEETMDIVKMVLIGKINTEIVARINKYGGSAVGLSGKSGRLFSARKKKGKIDLGLVGEISEINSDVVTTLIDKDYIPVISPVGMAKDGTSLNINADTATAKLSIALKADKLILLTGIKGVLDRNEKLISKLNTKEARNLIRKKIARAGMIPKLEACIEATKGGVKSAHIIKSREHAILEEVLTKEGTGTMIIK